MAVSPGVISAASIETKGIFQLRRTASSNTVACVGCLQTVRQALWAAYGPQMQRAWREQLMPEQAPPEFDPDEPF